MLILVIVVVSSVSLKPRNSNDTGTITVAASYTTSGDTTPMSDGDLVLMRLIDEIHPQWPFYGSRRIRDVLEGHGHPANRKRVQRLMRQMGLQALYPRRRTSQPVQGHKIYPYLLRGLVIA
jgi:hypothetical protein